MDRYILINNKDKRLIAQSTNLNILWRILEEKDNMINMDIYMRIT